MKKSLLPILLVSALALPLSGSAWANYGHHKGGAGIASIMKQLDLSSDQRAKLATIRKSNKDQNKANREAVKTATKGLKDGFKSNASDDQLNSLHAALQSARDKAQNARFSQMLAIRAVLTPDQRAKFHELMEAKHPKKDVGESE